MYSDSFCLKLCFHWLNSEVALVEVVILQDFSRVASYTSMTLQLILPRLFTYILGETKDTLRFRYSICHSCQKNNNNNKKNNHQYNKLILFLFLSFSCQLILWQNGINQIHLTKAHKNPQGFQQTVSLLCVSASKGIKHNIYSFWTNPEKTTSLLSTWWLAQRETASFVSPIPLMLRMRKNKINSLFHPGPVTKCFVHSSQLKTVKKCEEIVSWHQLAHKIAVVLRSKTWSHVSRRFKLGYCFLHHQYYYCRLSFKVERFSNECNKTKTYYLPIRLLSQPQTKTKIIAHLFLILCKSSALILFKVALRSWSLLSQ